MNYIDMKGEIWYNIIAGRNTLYTYETELTFKRHVMSSAIVEPPHGCFSYCIESEKRCANEHTVFRLIVLFPPVQFARSVGHAGEHVSGFFDER